MRRLISAISLIAALPLSAQTYSITHNYNVGGEGGWDYVIPDAPNHRLFIARQNRVLVVDMLRAVIEEYYFVGTTTN